MATSTAEIMALEIPPSSHVHVGRMYSAAVAMVPQEISKPEGYVDKGGIVAFVAGVSAQSKADVLNSTLLAQLAADKQYNREKSVMDWYGFYGTVLEKVGWVIQGYNWSKYDSSKISFTMDEAVLEIAAAALTGDEAAVIAATLDALRKLPKQDGRLQLFNHSASSEKEGNFQISVCSETDGAVAMRTMAFFYSTDQQSTDVLFFSFNSSSTSLTKSVQGQTLNSQVYTTVRDAVLTKLGDNAKLFVLDLDI
jgi:hypothetical protein